MKTLITISGNDVSARLDMTREVLIANSNKGVLVDEPKTILLSKSSAEDLCSFIIKEDISCVVCGGIEEKHYKYLQWKKTKVLSSIIGPYKEALQLLLKNRLTEGAILHRSGEQLRK